MAKQMPLLPPMISAIFPSSLIVHLFPTWLNFANQIDNMKIIWSRYRRSAQDQANQSKYAQSPFSVDQ